MELYHGWDEKAFKLATPLFAPSTPWMKLENKKRFCCAESYNESQGEGQLINPKATRHLAFNTFFTAQWILNNRVTSLTNDSPSVASSINQRLRHHVTESFFFQSFRWKSYSCEFLTRRFLIYSWSLKTLVHVLTIIFELNSREKRKKAFQAIFSLAEIQESSYLTN